VVYRTAIEIYSVPIGGGTSTKLSGPMVTGGMVSGFVLSPDGTTVLYVADAEVNGMYEIYTVPIFGGVVTKLNEPLPPGGDAYAPRFSPDNSTVVYLADQEVYQMDELFRVAAGGGPTMKLNHVLADDETATYDFVLTADGSAVVYRAGIADGGPWELYQTSMDADPGGFDRDGDGFGGACDCDDDDDAVWSAPSPIDSLRMTIVASVINLDWDPTPEPGAATVRYDVLRSPSPSDFVSSTVCLEVDDTDTSAIDPDLTAPGPLFYLIRVENDCPGSVGTLGAGSDGAPRTGIPCP
jgi:hypothetical protein